MSTDLAVIEAALKAATNLQIVWSLSDAHLIANAPAWLAELVERVKAAEAEVERLRELDHGTAGEAMMAAELRSQGRRRAVAEATIARVRELAESVPKTIAFNPSDAAYLSGQVDFAESVLDALNHTDGISPGPVLIDEVHRFTSANSPGVDETTLRARAEDATEPILRPTDQRYEPPAVDDCGGCCR